MARVSLLHGIPALLPLLRQRPGIAARPRRPIPPPRGRAPISHATPSPPLAEAVPRRPHPRPPLHSRPPPPSPVACRGRLANGAGVVAWWPLGFCADDLPLNEVAAAPLPLLLPP
ncbi:hypothetical protein SETIT_3G187100v2 [Setaria italica]|uniref:Uncharacterized protein n=1 Tax=Setaria italica TaxID=4555 RepID=A0A368QGF3_SETIT|nr:hypothetical protein SETIT_3G187100v2 [Setaria italica]